MSRLERREHLKKSNTLPTSVTGTVERFRFTPGIMHFRNGIEKVNEGVSFPSCTTARITNAFHRITQLIPISCAGHYGGNT